MKNPLKKICLLVMSGFLAGPLLNAVVWAGESAPKQRPAAATLTRAEQQIIDLQKELAAAKNRVDSLQSELSAAQETILEFKQQEAARIVNTGAAPGAHAVDQIVSGQPIYDAANPRQPVRQEDVIAGHFSPALQSRPAAVTRLQGDKLVRGGIREITRIADQVPGMSYGQTGNEARIAMRGVYSNRTGPEAEQVVAIFEDGVPVRTTTQALGPYVDIQRIDVLRGPQGVEYGRNAYGGVIDVVSNEPDLRGWDVFLEGSNAVPDRMRWEAMINIPITDTIAMRFAGRFDSHSGLINNHIIESDADDLKDRKQQYSRLMTKWQPSENFSMLLNLVTLDQNQTGSGIWGYQQIGAFVDGRYVPGHPFAEPGAKTDVGAWNVARNFASQADLENLGASLSLRWNIGFATLEWLGNSSKFESLQVFDSDYSSGGDAHSSDFNGWDSFRDTRFTELRLKSNEGARLDWLFGLQASDMESDWGWIETRNGIFAQPDWDTRGNYSTSSTNVFASAGYAFNDKLRLYGGLRWYDDSKQLRDGQKDSWSGVLWNAGVQYAFNDNIHTYLSASTGYRPGGINEVPGVPASYDAEEVTAYEIGMKSLLADGKISLNLSAFFNDYTSMQAQSFTVLPLPGTAGVMDYITTAGNMESKGIEVEFQWLPGTRWNISANLAWLDANFKDYTVPGLAGLGDIPGHTQGDSLSLRGWQPAFSPQLSLGLQASYIFSLGRWGTFTPMLQTTYTSEYYASNLNLEGARQSAQAITDLRLFWALPGNKVDLQVYLENITDQEKLSNVMIYNPEERPGVASFLADWGDPNVYGFVLSYHY